MSARELAEPCPSLSTDDDATEAAWLPAEYKLPALLVVDREGQPRLPVAMGVPPARTELRAWGRLPGRRFRLPTVGPDASVMHIAAHMARTHTPLVAVVEREGDETDWIAGAVTVTRLMERLVGAS
ncbi:CBS domain-containing protein [Streptomyces sp. NBC_01092]|uniref:CBS domain-containing protein n=1 Tax=Streptomyces sp. NBC_01092 TaxID=2903748 RepID=UPI00386C8169|nr:hypothetical protein OG254_40250 [Streptomyces sp. NBC_01092]